MGFDTCTPDEVGIKEEWLMRFLDRLEQQLLPMHSALIARGGKVCMETYYHPYNKESLHRMFSVTKSMVAMAIGLLIEEGKLSLTDKIVDYFPDKQPKEGPFPYTAQLTIKDMLEMRTCHHKTTYKAAGVTDWVGSFFTTKPSHVPGTSFAYDTSSTHVLGALVERLSNKNLLDYMREKCLDELGFSKDAYVLTDPCGISLGGSGLCATTRDLYILIQLIAGDGCVDGHQYLPADFIKDAKKKHSDPSQNQETLEEMQGYGYQLWLTRHDGWVLFGMGGQLAMYLPDKDLYMVVTADAQGRKGGVQLIYEAFFEEVYDKLTGSQTYATPKLSFKDYIDSRRIISVPGCAESPHSAIINHKEYICDDNDCSFKKCRVDVDASGKSGTFTYTKENSECAIHFGIGSSVEGAFPGYGFKYTASAAWKTDDFLLIKINIIDSDVGSLTVGLNYKGPYITVVLKKVLEYKLDEYSGVFSGYCSSL